MKKALIFPGQGAQYVGMGKDFYDSFAIARETFQEADEILQENLTKIIFEGPPELLTETRNSQVAIFVVSVAILRVFQSQFPDFIPDACAGLSLGEYTALYASGRLSFKETLKLVAERARLMNEACENTAGTMAAVLGLSASQVEEAVRDIEGVWVANFNAPGQTVISGTQSGVEKAAPILKEKGAKRVLPLTVHGAFHSGLMKSAQEGLAPSIQKANLQKSSIDFVMNVPGAFVKIDEEIKEYLISQVTQSVRWEQGVETMKAAGIELFVEIGCGKSLSGLNRKIGVPHMKSIEKLSDLETIDAIT